MKATQGQSGHLAEERGNVQEARADGGLVKGRVRLEGARARLEALEGAHLPTSQSAVMSCNSFALYRCPLLCYVEYSSKRCVQVIAVMLII